LISASAFIVAVVKLLSFFHFNKIMNSKISILLLSIIFSASPILGKDNISQSVSSNHSPNAFQKSTSGKSYLYQISPRKLLEFWLKFPDIMFDSLSASERELYAELRETRERLKLKHRETELQKQLDVINRQLKKNGG
jgi:hypothetical protein